MFIQTHAYAAYTYYMANFLRGITVVFYKIKASPPEKIMVFVLKITENQ